MVGVAEDRERAGGADAHEGVGVDEERPQALLEHGARGARARSRPSRAARERSWLAAVAAAERTAERGSAKRLADPDRARVGEDAGELVLAPPGEARCARASTSGSASSAAAQGGEALR